jgi:hypothetical protein
MNSKSFWDCHQCLVKLAEYNRIELVWVLGHMGIDGNETADQLARQVCAIPLTGPVPSLGISAKVVRGVIRDCMSRKREEHRQSVGGQRQPKGFPKKTVCTKKLGNCPN